MLKDQFPILLIPLEFVIKLGSLSYQFHKETHIVYVYKDNNPSMNQIHGWYAKSTLIMCST